MNESPAGKRAVAPSPDRPVPSTSANTSLDPSPNVTQDASIRSLLDSVDISSSLELLKTLQSRQGGHRHVSSTWSSNAPHSAKVQQSLSPRSSLSEMRATSSRLSSPQPLLPEHRKEHASNTSLKSKYDEQEHHRSLSLKKVKKWYPRKLLHSTPEKSTEKAEQASPESIYPSPDRDREVVDLLSAQRDMEGKQSFQFI